jgi:NAD(P)-dependent dehydrogenase (short-subunit alcohol dehydrogenase family)
MKLQDKVAIVTGAGRGIGFAYAERFLREGAKVAIAELNPELGKKAGSELEELGDVMFVETDVASEESTQRSARAVADRFGGIDVLVNNAALYGDWNMADQSYEYLRAVMDVNQFGVWLMTRAVAPHLVERGGGAIINQASGAAYNYGAQRREEFGNLSSYNYAWSKWGVVGLTKFSAAELGQWNIRVNCIAPGVIDTEATLKVVPAEIISTLAERQTVPGQLHAEHLTGTAVYFASDDSLFVTGQVLVVDGGKHMPA